MRRVLPILLLLVVAACAAPHDPEVTFYADGKTVTVQPTQYCDVKSENCDVDTQATGVLKVRPGKPVQISVPGDLAKTAWSVKFTYRDAQGTPQEPLRSKLFTKNDPQYAYTLVLPNPGDQLESVEVQQYGSRIEASTTGTFDFVARGTWVLSVDDRK
ncbi:DUF2771 family protein [Actinosynnema sp. NPDC047251]|uniref:Secreted protein n=1 Tax=Saccharothrix espanaensis (strain ATCC 51144 / DSM 44229 / JCM 9112 / NBRC 15066 / NRRL 15764) TaxID=1179773 RepID=K0JQF0_SACES|nr:DUF2771 family protein [Saccharothrix espanaensis]CCH27856.1 hypothetical protein BN6_05250 [Saccharothrix espanaensis DSM 44229]